ncbi:type IV toxin-antitoxin system AbiEi family antitoxin domain-containing protein [Agromyces sp. NPDC055658]
MRRSDGVARMANLQAAGHSRHHLRRALEAGRIVRVRRGWVALPNADAHLVAAARAGVVITCVTRARQLGLWVLEDDGAHVAKDAHGAVPPLAARVHWSRPLVPRHPDALVDPIENVLALVARSARLPRHQGGLSPRRPRLAGSAGPHRAGGRAGPAPALTAVFVMAPGSGVRQRSGIAVNAERSGSRCPNLR